MIFHQNSHPRSIQLNRKKNVFVIFCNFSRCVTPSLTLDNLMKNIHFTCQNQCQCWVFSSYFYIWSPWLHWIDEVHHTSQWYYSIPWPLTEHLLVHQEFLRREKNEGIEDISRWFIGRSKWFLHSSIFDRNDVIQSECFFQWEIDHPSLTFLIFFMLSIDIFGKIRWCRCGRKILRWNIILIRI